VTRLVVVLVPGALLDAAGLSSFHLCDIPFDCLSRSCRSILFARCRAGCIDHEIYVIEGLFKRVNCYLYSMNFNEAVRDDDVVSKS